MAEQTATQIIQDELQQYGLDFSKAVVTRWAEMLADNRENITIIRAEIEESQEFAARFPGIAQRLDNGYNAISPAEYLELEDSYRSIFRSLGMPEQFYDDPEELAEFIANDVAPTELETRAAEGFLAAKNAPIEVKQALEEFYGVGDTDGALAAYYLDPDKGLEAIQREFISAQIAGTAQQTGFGELTKEEAEELTSLGVSRDEARAGFGELKTNEQLFQTLPGQRGPEFSREELLDATFENDATVLDKIRRQRDSRLSQFQGPQGGQAIDQRGVLTAQ